jgi:hypothetical protein
LENGRFSVVRVHKQGPNQLLCSFLRQAEKIEPEGVRLHRCQETDEDTTSWKKGLATAVMICELWRLAVAL